MGYDPAGTIAQKVMGRLFQPSTTWLAWTNTYLATVGGPKRAVYRAGSTRLPRLAMMPVFEFQLGH